MARQRTLRRVYGQMRVFDPLTLALFARKHPRTAVAYRVLDYRGGVHGNIIVAHAQCAVPQSAYNEVRELENPNVANHMRCAYCSAVIRHHGGEGI